MCMLSIQATDFSIHFAELKAHFAD
jgi:hypothetical protein